MTEQELIVRARQGERAAIEALYAKYAARVFAVVRRLSGDDALAEDWAQEAWIRAIRALPKFRGDAQFSTWLHRIAVNSALHGQRWRGRRAGREEALPETYPAPATEERPVLKVRIERALARLPERMRQVLVLHDVEGHTHEEIAEMLGIMPGTSKSQLFKARAHMRTLLSGARDVVNGEEVCFI
jgi:RNA polymerase sigma-70 factor (ECF subfamily)